MNDFSQIATETEKLLEKIYISVSAVALLSAAIFCTIIFIGVGFSSFSIMQAIGSILFVLLLSSVYLYFKKKYIYHQIKDRLSELETTPDETDKTDSSQQDNTNPLPQNNQNSSDDTSNNSADSDSTTTPVHDQFMDYLNHHLTDYELTQNLFKAFNTSTKNK